MNNFVQHDWIGIKKMDTIGKDVENEIYKWKQCLEETRIWQSQVQQIHDVEHEEMHTEFDYNARYKVEIGINGTGVFTYRLYEWTHRKTLEYIDEREIYAIRFFTIS